MKMILYFFFLLTTLTAQAQTSQLTSAISGGGGNGGDYIRMKFMDVGNFILKNYKIGLKEIEPLVDIENLRKTLSIQVISLSEKPLRDNRGSLVDAIGEPGRIILFQGDEKKGTGWYGIFTKPSLVEKLVLHEMLRAAGVNDDDYIHSEKVLSRYDQSNFDVNLYIRWCSETASFIDSALKQGIRSKTFAEQSLIYQKTLERVETLVSPKNFGFIAPSVNGALRVSPLFKTVKGRALFQRTALQQIAKDIRYVDAQLRNRHFTGDLTLGDHARYAASYIRSAMTFTLYGETPEVEEFILNVVFEQVYAYLVNSEYARTKYGQVFAELDSARHSPVLSYKRQALAYIEYLLK